LNQKVPLADEGDQGLETETDLAKYDKNPKKNSVNTLSYALNAANNRKKTLSGQVT
jgi:hypothetical protein